MLVEKKIHSSYDIPIFFLFQRYLHSILVQASSTISKFDSYKRQNNINDMKNVKEEATH